MIVISCWRVWHGGGGGGGGVLVSCSIVHKDSVDHVIFDVHIYHGGSMYPGYSQITCSYILYSCSYISDIQMYHSYRCLAKESQNW